VYPSRQLRFPIEGWGVTQWFDSSRARLDYFLKERAKARYDIRKDGYRIRNHYDFMRVDDTKPRRTREINKMLRAKKNWLLDSGDIDEVRI